jgi:hypothetical protein
MKAKNYYELHTGGEFNSISQFWYYNKFVHEDKTCIYFCDKWIKVDKLKLFSQGCEFSYDRVLTRSDFFELSLRNPMITFCWHFCSSIKGSLDKSDRAFGIIEVKNGRVLISIETSYSCCDDFDKEVLIKSKDKITLNSVYLYDRMKVIYPDYDLLPSYQDQD